MMIQIRLVSLILLLPDMHHRFLSHLSHSFQRPEQVRWAFDMRGSLLINDFHLPRSEFISALEDYRSSHSPRYALWCLSSIPTYQRIVQIALESIFEHFNVRTFNHTYLRRQTVSDPNIHSFSFLGFSPRHLLRFISDSNNQLRP